jgi:surface antigen
MTEKEMNKTLFKIASICLVPLFLLGSRQAFAVAHPYDFHADARMVHQNLGPVAKAYGYMNVVTDTNGQGIINVMFSNGSQLNWARFNARVKFLDATGTIIKEEIFDQRIAAAGNEGAVERKVSKSLTVSDFDSIQVDFYLTD